MLEVRGGQCPPGRASVLRDRGLWSSGESGPRSGAPLEDKDFKDGSVTATVRGEEEVTSPDRKPGRLAGQPALSL